MPAATHSPGPLIEAIIVPKSRVDRDLLGKALSTLTAEDLSLRVTRDEESGQFTLGGLSEIHLDSKIDRLKRMGKIDVHIDAVQVAHRETLTRRIERDHTHRTQTGGTGQFARVTTVCEPNEAGAGTVFESRIVAGTVPNHLMPGVEKGITGVMGAGVLAGFPVVGVKVTLINGAFHDVDSSVLAFEIASRAAFRAALQNGGAVLLEPIMTVEVAAPENCAGLVIGDLNARRSQIQGQNMRAEVNVVTAMIPLGNMFGFASTLRSFSRGRATFTMQFDHYAPVMPLGGPPAPPAVAAPMRGHRAR